VNKIVVIANSRFEKGLIAFINSYRKVNMQSQLVIIDTGLENNYPYETIKRYNNSFNFKKAPWMLDCSPYHQLQLAEIEADKIIYLEADMLLLKNIDHLFDEIDDNEMAISVMDDAAFATMQGPNYIDNCGRYFIEESELKNKYARCKGYNGGLIGGAKQFYTDLQELFGYYLEHYESQYRLLAQSLLNQYFIERDISVHDVGLEYNFSGINEYYDKPELYDIIKEGKYGYDIYFNNFPLSVVHFTGKEKPFLVDNKNIMTPVFDYYYNKGELFNEIER
jgi:lipopolysaccharide biosynthesis glycosyltransferase